MNKDFIKNHEFKHLQSTSIDGIPLYSISIYRKQDSIEVLGEIFISKGDFKIYKMDYAVFDLSKAKETKIGKLVYEIKVEYKPYKGKMYLNYISFNNAFEVLQPPAFFPIDAKIHYKKEVVSNYTNLNFNKMELEFNNTPDIKNVLRKRNYQVRYEGEKLKIVNVELNKDMVVLYLDEELKVPSWKLRNSSIEDYVSVKIKKIKDTYGNLINEQKYKDYYQFREFFVQELKVNSNIPADDLYMQKNKSIFNNQPIAPFENTEDYWLKTRLKKEKIFENVKKTVEL
ncbi:hypothetical protein LB452_06455 [Psychroflexus sp. CAK8W]|uniref:Uncharacterized protein n=1 Tax=Psychroflexus longus TaxID=2873596 RepID=A0ABS7XKF0_9FLAO|nr:hypothetical protein [Psychroflexus longus]MBZ9778561.1 hypothetical protein [Psychroflexus longus]